MNSVRKKLEEEDMRFEDALAGLEATVKRLESENLDLDESLRLYEKGMRFAEVCRRKLDEAEKKIERLARTAEGPVVVADAGFQNFPSGEGAPPGEKFGDDD